MTVVVSEYFFHEVWRTSGTEALGERWFCVQFCVQSPTVVHECSTCSTGFCVQFAKQVFIFQVDIRKHFRICVFLDIFHVDLQELYTKTLYSECFSVRWPWAFRNFCSRSQTVIWHCSTRFCVQYSNIERIIWVHGSSIEKSNRIQLNIIMTVASVCSSCIVSDAMAWRQGTSRQQWRDDGRVETSLLVSLMIYILRGTSVSMKQWHGRRC